MNEKNLKKLMIGQYLIIVLLAIICLFLLIDRKSVQRIEDSNTKSTDIEYDVSMMNSLDLRSALKLFNDGKVHLLYIGRSTCGICRKVLPSLQAAQKELEYKTDYLDITTVDRNTDDWEKLERLMDKRTSMSITNNDGQKELVTNTFGYFIGNYGYTPSLIIISNNKMIDGHIGNISQEELIEWLQTNGIG